MIFVFITCFYTSFSLPLPLHLRFIQSKPFSSGVPTALSPHCRGCKFQFATKERERPELSVHQEIMGNMGKISDSRLFRCWRGWGWKKRRSIMAKRLHTTAACVATLFFSNNSKTAVQAGRKAAERVNPLFLGTGKSGDLLGPTSCCQRQWSSTPILGARSGTPPSPRRI